MTWGVWGKQLKKTEMMALMHYCIDQNITTFDHADIYGGYTTEADFGHAFAESGIDRNRVQLISKCGIQLITDNRKSTVKHYNYNKDHIIWSAEKSIKDLKTDHLDLLLLHRPSPLMDVNDIAEAISNLKKRGLIKAIGLSNFTPLQTDMLSQIIEVTANQIEFSVTEHSALFDGSLDHMVTNNITPMAWSPLGIAFKEDNEQTRRIHTQLGELRETYNATEDQLLLAWILKHPSKIHPVIGTTTTQRIAAAAKALEMSLSLEDWFKILEASRGIEVA